MDFIGSTAFKLPVLTSQKSTSSAPTPTEDSLTQLHKYTEQMIRVFLEKSLPQLITVAAGHTVQHIVFWHSELPEDLRDKVKEELDSISGFHFVECNILTEPVSLDFIGISDQTKTSDHPTYGRYRLAPNEIISLNFFETIAKYGGFEYAGMNLKLFGGLKGYTITNDITVIPPADSTLDDFEIIEIRDRRTNSVNKILPLHDPTRSAINLPTVVDGSGTPLLRLVRGHTAALWKEPEEGPDSKDEKDSAMEEIRRQFPVLSEALHFSTESNLELIPVSEQVSQAKFSMPVQGFTLDLMLRTEERVPAGQFFVSYQLVDDQGTPVPPDADLVGIGRIENPEIAHCFIPEVAAGESRIVKHIRPPVGIFCTGIKFIHRHTSTIQIEVVSARTVFNLKENE